MKKYFLFAAAALVALSACSKVETPSVSNDTAISFKVANYKVATKAGETSLITEGFTTFNTYAWYTSSTDANQPFMTPATVTWDSGNTQWAPSDRTYFWPKTGYINFFSFAGNFLPSTVALNGSAQAVATYAENTIATNSNILVADGAYGFFNNDAAVYKLDGVTKGVPTLFRHMLSKVKFDINLDAEDVADTKNHWSVTVNSATVSYRNKGTLEVVFPTAPSRTLDADGHPTVAGETIKYTTATWTAATAENATLSKVSSAVTTEVDGGSKSAAVDLIAESVVMPQTLDATNVTITLNYTLTHTYDNGTPVVETVPISAKALTTFAPSIAAWTPNTIYTYHITIKPAGEGLILFDPAVEQWAEEANEPTYVIE